MKTKLISADAVKMVRHTIKSDKFNLEKVDGNNSLSFYIGRARIVRGAGERKPITNLEMSFTKEYGKIWYNDVGKVLLNEMKKSDPQLFILTTKLYKALLKRIDENTDDVDWLAERGLFHIKIADYDYVIIRIAKLDDSFSMKDKNNDYFSDSDIELIVNKEDDNFDNSRIVIASAPENDSVELF